MNLKSFLTGLVAGAIIIFLLTRSCHRETTDDSNLKSEVIELRKQSEDNVIESSEKEALIYWQKQHLQNDSVIIANKESELAFIKKNQAAKLNLIKDFNAEQSADFFRSKYSPSQAITVSGNKVSTEDVVTRQIIADVSNGESLVEELGITNGILETERVGSKRKDSIIITQEQQKNLLNGSIEAQNAALDRQDKIISNAEKNLKKQERKTLLWKIGAGIALVAGFLIGN